MTSCIHTGNFVRHNPGVIPIGTTIDFASGYSITYRQHGSVVVIKPLDIKKVAAGFIEQGGDKKQFGGFHAYLSAQGYVVSVLRNHLRFDLGNDHLMDEAWGKMPY